MPNKEILMREDDYIVSKTDKKGKITYGNRIFIEFSGYKESELLGQPHSIIRHPDMPRSVFRLLWHTLQEGREFFGFVKNRTKQHDFYWTFANVTPSYDAQGVLLGYYSVRRCPRRESVQAFAEMYQNMLEVERGIPSAREAMDASIQLLLDAVNQSEKKYDEFILSFEQ